MNAMARTKLVELVARFGRELSEDHRRCEALLRDVCGDQHPREISVLVSAVKDRAAADLAAPINGTPVSVLLDRLSRRLHDRLCISEDFARWSVESWAIALGVVSEGTDSTVSVADIVTVTPAIFEQGDPDDPFAEEASVTPEEMLRRAIRRVLADGVVTDEEKYEIQTLRRSIGIGTEVASRIFTEEKQCLSKSKIACVGPDIASPPPLRDDGITKSPIARTVQTNVQIPQPPSHAATPQHISAEVSVSNVGPNSKLLKLLRQLEDLLSAGVVEMSLDRFEKKFENINAFITKNSAELKALRSPPATTEILASIVQVTRAIPGGRRNSLRKALAIVRKFNAEVTFGRFRG